MALKAMKCPNCYANIMVDGGRAYVFCTYCGVQIRLAELTEHKDMHQDEMITFTKCMDEGELHLKSGDFYHAEIVFMQIVNEYPSIAMGYEKAIEAITQNYTLFTPGNQERVFALANKMCIVAFPEEKEHCEKLKSEIFSYYMETMRLHSEAERQWQMEENGRKMRKKILAFVLSFFYSVLMAVAAKEMPVFWVFFGISAVFMIKSLIAVVLYKRERDTFDEESY